MLFFTSIVRQDVVKVHYYELAYDRLNYMDL